MGGLIFVLLICYGVYRYFKWREEKYGTDMWMVKFDYDTKKTALPKKSVFIIAAIFLALCLLAYSHSSDKEGGRATIGFLLLIYLAFILFRLWNRRKAARFKKKAVKLPGKIVGMKYKEGNWDYKEMQRSSGLRYLIVEYPNPRTGRMEEYTTKESVNGNPFYYLKSLDVTVYYRDDEHIRVEDFRRIKRFEENIAFQVTGKVDGKDPGVLRYEHIGG